MNTVYDVRQLLKRFGTFIYVGDRSADLQLMESEVKELYSLQFIGPDEYAKAITILRKETTQLQNKE